MLNQKSKDLFVATYDSMLERTAENGYAKTSITGAYPGMFGRDSSIQIMSHIAVGDYDYALKLLSFIVEYHKKHDANYVLHIMYNDDFNAELTPPDDTLQPDATFFFLHAWYLYATQAPESEIKTVFLES